MPLQATSGAASYDAFGGGVPVEPNYIESVFSTWLYTGNGSTQTITNGIDLAGKGGLVWSKRRSSSGSNFFVDTVRGASNYLLSNLDIAQVNSSGVIPSFSSTGYETGTSLSPSGETFVSWTFRKQPKFFDVVTYTGNGSSTQTISHNLGSTPGAVIIKSTAEAKNWAVWHRTQPFEIGKLNLTDAWTTFNYFITSNGISSTTFQVGGGNNSDANNLTNVNGQTYVAYLFAHNAGGFGLTGTDNVISCGSYTGNATAGNAITLGYEPQWIMIKQASGSDAGTNSWSIYDNMRGMPNGSSNDNRLEANNSNAEVGYPEIAPTATGFICEATGGRLNASGGTYIYIAIRRGPMKVPESGTSVFSPNAVTATVGTTVTTGFPVDAQLFAYRLGYSDNSLFADRLRGVSTTATNSGPGLLTSSTAAEATPSGGSTRNWSNTGFQVSGIFGPSDSQIYWNFRRAPGFFDEVCWTGDSTNPRSINHNLTVAPTLIITKKRSSTSNWTTGFDFASTTYKYFYLNDTGAATSDTYASSPVYGGNPTASVFIVGNQGNMNISGDTYVSYLFATCPGVSKVGSYTGNGTTQTIDCGFAAGSRFVLIKRTDSTGDWYVWDSARGIVAGTDPRLALNSTAAEVNANWVYATTGGFEIVTSDAAVNASGGSYIFLSVA